MKISRFNYVSDHGKDHQKLLINFLSQSVDIIESEPADYFSGNIKTNKLSDEYRDYSRKRGYIYSNELRESQIIASLYDYEFKNKATIYAVHLDTFSKEKSQFSKISKSINELIVKAPESVKSELYIYNRKKLDHFFNIQDLKDFIKICKSLDMDIILLTTPVSLSFFKPILNRELLAEIILICPVSKYGDPPYFLPDTEAFLDDLIEHETKITIELELMIENVIKVKQLIDYFIFKGWAILDNFNCRLESEEEKSCFFGYSYNTNIKLVKEIFQLFRTYWQTEICSMEKWIGINNIHSLIWRGRPPRPSLHFCSASKGLVVFTGDGQSYPCLKMAESKPETAMQVNTLFGDFQKRNGMMLPECKNCGFAVSCGGGCSYNVFIQNKSGVCCPPIKELFETALETYFEELIEKSAFIEYCQSEA